MGRKARGRAYTKPKADLQMPRQKPHGFAGITTTSSHENWRVSDELKKRAKSGRWFHRSQELIEHAGSDGELKTKLIGKTYRRPKAEGK